MKRAVSIFLALVLFFSFSNVASAQDISSSDSAHMLETPAEATHPPEDSSLPEDSAEPTPPSDEVPLPDDSPDETSASKVSVNSPPVPTLGVLNLVPNGGFEVADDSELGVEGWGFWNAGSNKTDFTIALDTDIFTEGTQSLYIKSDNLNVRLSPSIRVPLEAGKYYIVSAQIKLEDVRPSSVNNGVYYRLQFNDADNKKVSDYMPQTPLLSGTQDWETYEIVFQAPENTANASFEYFVQHCTGQVWIDNVQVYETVCLGISNAPGNMAIGDSLQLLAQTSDGSELPSLSWSSSNGDVVAVNENGLAEAVAPGTAVITVTADNFQPASTTIYVAADSSQYELLRDRWRNRITGNGIDAAIRATDTEYLAEMDNITQNAKGVWDTYIKRGDTPEDERTTLWPDMDLYFEYPGPNVHTQALSSRYTTAYNRIRSMALAWAAEGSGLYHNEELGADIVDALHWMHDNVYNETYDSKMGIFGNWWDWFIGMPQHLADTIILMYDVLDEEFIFIEYLTLHNWNEDPFFVWTPYQKVGTMTSANLMDTALVSILKNAIGEQGDGIEMGLKALSTVLPYTTSGDGVYADGSIIQHETIPYIGGYGTVLLRGVEKFVFLLSDTDFAPTDPAINNVYHWILESFRPMITQGAMFDMVRGRGIANASATDKSSARGAILPMVLISESAPVEYKALIQSFIKKTAQEGIAYYGDDYFRGMNLSDMMGLKRILDDESIIPLENEDYLKIYGAMDKVAYHTGSYTVGISMYSSRVANGESGNGENLKGWHVSDGALYLYMGDETQYIEDYWPTVDPMRLSGITTDHSTGTPNNFNPYTNDRNWVGGSSVLGSFGSVGMDFAIENSSLNGYKSWFLFGDVIVAVGADIQSGEAAKPVETIVENRKVLDNQSNQLLVEGQEINSLGEQQVPDATWAWLQGNSGSGSDSTGYYFPQPTDVDVLRETRTGSWRDINEKGDTSLITRQYASLAISHGLMPTNESYSYVLLPGYTRQQTEAYAQNPSIEILANTGVVQAARSLEHNITGMNFFKAGSLSYVTATTPLSISIFEDGEEITIGVSDPSQKNGTTAFALTGYDWSVISADAGVSTRQTNEGLVVEVNTDGSLGGTFTLKLQRADKDNADLLQALVEQANTLRQGDYTVQSWKTLQAAIMEAKRVLALVEIDYEAQRNAYSGLSSAIGLLVYRIPQIIMGADEIRILPPEDGSDVRYTLNGTDPSVVSPRYFGPISLESLKEYGSRVEIRAAVFDGAELCGGVAGTVVTLSNIAPTASRVESERDHSAGYAGSMAVDGDMSTRWATQSNTGSTKLTLYFDAPVTVDEAVIQEFRGANNYITEYRIEYWDGKAWLLASEVTDATMETTFAPVTSTQIRLNITVCNNPSIYEFELYGPTGSTADTTGLQAALELGANALLRGLDAEMTEENLQRFTLAFSSSQKIFAAPATDQEVVDAAAEDLMATLEALKLVYGDPSQLRELIAASSGYIQSEHSTQNWSRYEAAIAYARSIAEDAAATRYEVDKAYWDLQLIINDLDAEKGSNEIVGYTRPDDIEVIENTPYTLPTTVEVQLGQGIVNADVVWNDTVQIDTPNSYEIDGTLPDYANYPVAMTVVVIADTVVSVDLPSVVKVPVGTQPELIREALPTEIRATMSSGKSASLPVEWEETSGLDTTEPSTLTVYGTARGWDERIAITVQVYAEDVEPYPTGHKNPEDVSIYVGDAFTMPDALVYFSDGTSETWPVKWNEATYDITREGTYHVTGSIEGLPEYEGVVQFTLTVRKVDKTHLAELYERYRNTKNEAYTEKSWTRFTRALTEASAALRDDTARQTRVDAARVELEASWNALEKEKGSSPYQLVRGKDAKYTGDGGLVFTVDATIEEFSGVYVNGTELQINKHYTVKAGSVIVTLLPAYLDTLTNGSYAVEIQFTGGTVSASFDVSVRVGEGDKGGSGTGGNGGSAIAPTGDSTRLWLWLALSLVAIAGLSAVAVFHVVRRKKSNGHCVKEEADIEE